ncbi:hypothetical protein EIK56_24845 [Sphingomonas sp. C8-2]|nr:hypothetical protein EIK56_24845 [Sphingomonas sp. C8-2]
MTSEAKKAFKALESLSRTIDDFFRDNINDDDLHGSDLMDILGKLNDSNQMLKEYCDYFSEDLFTKLEEKLPPPPALSNDIEGLGQF